MGGNFFLPIPLLNNSQQISDEWKRVIVSYNPDFIYSFCHLNKETENTLYKCQFHVPFNDNLTQVNKDIKIIDQPNSLSFIGQPLFNSLLLNGLYDGEPKSQKLNYISSEDDIDLFYKAYFGILDKNIWLSWQYNYINDKYHIPNPESIFEKPVFEKNENFFHFLFNNFHRNRENYIPSLLDTTLNNLNSYFSGHISFDPQKNKTNNIVVISNSENLEDFCWFWSIRSQRSKFYDQIFPVWINANEITNNEIIKNHTKTYNCVYFISKEVKIDEFPINNNKWKFQTDNLDEFYSDFYFVGSKEQYFVNFENNRTQFQVPINKLLDHYHPEYNQTSFIEINIPNYCLPTIDTPFWGTEISSGFTPTKYGLTKLLLQHKQIVKLDLPNPLQVIETFGRMQNYSVTLSDKGKRANEIINLLGDDRKIWVISFKQIMDLFHNMSNLQDISSAKKLIRNNVVDEQIAKDIINLLPRTSIKPKTKSYSILGSQLKKILKNESFSRLIKWLLKRNILQQGNNVKCPRCFIDNWIPIEQFNKSIKCIGCNNIIDIPFGVDKIDWEYMINSLIISGFDQGVLVHLLTGYYLIDESNSINFTNDVYGAFYGMDFINKINNTKKEVDIAFLIKNKLVIGECKVSGKELSTDEINQLITFAQEIYASKIVFACLSDLEVLQDRINETVKDMKNILLLGPEELYNQSPGKLLFKNIENSNFDNLTNYKRHLENL